MTTNNDYDNNDNINKNNHDSDDPFALIEKGYECQQESPWESAHYFLQASSVLRSQAYRICPSTSTSTTTTSTTQQYCHDYKTRKIAALYEDQSNFYLLQARKSLIDAMQRELDRDEKLSQSIPSRVQVVKYLAGELLHDDVMIDLDTKGQVPPFEPKMNSLTLDEIQKRRKMFCKLFASSFTKEDKDDEEGQVTERSLQRNATPTSSRIDTDKTLSLEERLSLLNSSMADMISPPKSDEQRLKDLHKSLSGLGVTVPTTGSIVDNSPTYVSEDEAVDEIINMAKDEVNLMTNTESEKGSRDVLLDLIHNSSIRLNLDDSDNDSEQVEDDDDDDDDSAKKTNTTDAELNFWRNLKIESEDTDKEPMSKMEKMKQYLETAQQLLLQASVCVEELKNEGYSLGDEQQEIPLEHEQGAVESGQDLSDTLQNQHVSSDENDAVKASCEEICQEGTSKNNKSKGCVSWIVSRGDMDGDQAKEDSDDDVIANLVQTGKSSLEEALDKVEKVKALWSSGKLVRHS
jgi:hypothetical protein